MLNKEHNTPEGVLRSQKTVNIKASLNLGLSNDLKEAFPYTMAATKPEVYTKSNKAYNNLHPGWVAGFFCFFLLFIS